MISLIIKKNNADGEEEWIFNKAGIDKILANNESYKTLCSWI